VLTVGVPVVGFFLWTNVINLLEQPIHVLKKYLLQAGKKILVGLTTATTNDDDNNSIKQRPC
jgi:hypothetical protein